MESPLSPVGQLTLFFSDRLQKAFNDRTKVGHHKLEPTSFSIIHYSRFLSYPSFQSDGYERAREQLANVLQLQIESKTLSRQTAQNWFETIIRVYKQEHGIATPDSPTNAAQGGSASVSGSNKEYLQNFSGEANASATGIPMPQAQATPTAPRSTSTAQQPSPPSFNQQSRPTSTTFNRPPSRLQEMLTTAQAAQTKAQTPPNAQASSNGVQLSHPPTSAPAVSSSTSRPQPSSHYRDTTSSGTSSTVQPPARSASLSRFNVFACDS